MADWEPSLWDKGDWVVKDHAIEVLWSEPCADGSPGGPGAGLAVRDVQGQFAALTPERRRGLREELAAGRLDELCFRALTFRAVYQNVNFLRFRDEDLPRLAASYAGMPFLRDHDQRRLEARGGIVRASALEGQAFLQEIALTVPRDIEAFLNGQIDRFSIAWNWTGITCSVCGSDWLRGDCLHWPGRKYKHNGEEGVLCELIFEQPTGREVSAVNVPAVAGTGVKGVLDQLCSLKLEWMADREAVDAALDNRLGEVSDVDGEVLDHEGLDHEGAKGREADEARRHEGGEAAELLAAQRQAVLEARLSGSGLPGELAELVRQSLRPGWRLAELEATIENAKAAWAKLEEQQTVKHQGRALDGGRVAGMTAPQEALQGAMDWLLGVRSAKLPAPSLRRIDVVYQALTGDWDWYGRFDPSQAGLAMANSATLADMATNAMNKVILEQFGALAVYRWFEQLVTVQPHDGSTLPMQWISYGGTGDLPTVNEGAAYTESTIADAKESSNFVKKGKYVGITLEMIRRSDIARIQAVPRALALDAVRTRSAAIAGLFTANSGTGPVLADDSKALFHTDHGGNVQVTAFSAAAWKAARSECAKMTELGSAKRLGLYPRYCLVPIDLYDDALVVFGYGQGPGGYPNTPNNDVNPYGASRPGDDRPVPVKVPEWTDAADWAYLVDPVVFPVIQMSYAQAPGGGSHPAPELFSVASPTSGLMFSNDVLPVKVRDWFAYGVSTWRGVGKRNV